MHGLTVISGILLMLVSYCAGDCNVGQPLGFIFEGRDIPDSAFSASSSVIGDHQPYRARFGKYFDSSCAWVSAGARPIWIQVDLAVPATAYGIVVRKRCDAPWDFQHITSYELQVQNGNGWTTLLSVNTMSYKFGPNDIRYFAGPVEGQIWRLVVLTYNGHPSLKFDLIGCL